MIQQRTLRRLLDDSVAARTHRFGDAFELARDAAATPEPERPSLTALVLLRGFDLDEFVAGTCAFVDTLDERERRRWYREFTRTVFLVGEHRRLPARFARLLRHSTRNMAWGYSDGGGAGVGLRRLLKPLRTAGLPELPERHRSGDGDGDGDGGVPELTVATGGLTLERYLVHLNHALSESLIAGALEPGRPLELRHVESIDSMPLQPAYARVVPDPEAPGRLTAAAYLSPISPLSPSLPLEVALS